MNREYNILLEASFLSCLHYNYYSIKLWKYSIFDLFIRYNINGSSGVLYCIILPYLYRPCVSKPLYYNVLSKACYLAGYYSLQYSFSKW